MSDLFDDALHVESRFYDQGYNDGMKDGAQSGLAEGRAFGLQRGFEKFLDSGRMAGKTVVWANRLPGNQQPAQQTALPPLPNNARLQKNIDALYALVDPQTVPMENSDDAVQDFDDRLKKAQGKERIIDRMVGGSNKAGSSA